MMNKNNNFRKYRMFLEPTLSGLLILCGFGLLRFSSIVSTLLFIIAFIIGGYQQAIEGFVALREEHKFSVEFLMIFAAIGACLIGFWEEGATLIFIFSLSGALETYTQDKSRKEIQSLLNLEPSMARLLTEDGKTKQVLVDRLEVGQHVLVLPGDTVPIDGVIFKGTSSFNEAAITGEAMPKSKTIGAEIFGGTSNVSGPIEIVVTKAQQDTLLRKIVAMVAEAQNNPSKSERLIERIENKYVLTVLVVAGVMLFLPHYLLGWSWTETFYRTMVLLVVASPCALVASITPATLAAISNGAKNGMLIKGGIYLERLARTEAICFDKTGTLTYGIPKMTNLYFEESSSVTHTEILNAIVSLEQFSTHPLAKAITIAGQERKEFTDIVAVTEMVDVPGNGIQGMIAGKLWKIGKREFVAFDTASLPLKEQSMVAATEGKTIVYVEYMGNVVAFLAMQDIIRPGVKEAMFSLKNSGITTVLLTGDNEHTGKAIAAAVGIQEVHANCLPDEKVAHLRDIAASYENIVMVGDGINDAPALAYASIGVAMGKGSDIAIESADVVLMESDITKIAYLVALAKRLQKISLQNVVFSLGVIATLLILNFTQILTLPFGVVGHEGSTILVILNGLRLLGFCFHEGK